MTRLDSPPQGSRTPLALRPRPSIGRTRATWRQADPARIDASLQQALGRDAGGWYVAGTTGALRADRSSTLVVDGREVVLWRAADGRLLAGPGACPHLGALLDRCPVQGGALRCRWHGLALTGAGRADWAPLPAHDDGALLWVRLPTAGETPTAAPVVGARPAPGNAITAVSTCTGVCEPADVIANRLDPWHGSWFHPYAFSHLTVDEQASAVDRIVVDVTFRLGRTLGVPVRAEFVCPDRRTVTMRIIDGEGTGSVVETHATPLGADEHGRSRTAVTEVTVAHSDRPGFRAARVAAPLVRMGMRLSADRLWRDDLAYAERRYELRRRAAAH